MEDNLPKETTRTNRKERVLEKKNNKKVKETPARMGRETQGEQTEAESDVGDKEWRTVVGRKEKKRIEVTDGGQKT